MAAVLTLFLSLPPGIVAASSLSDLEQASPVVLSQPPLPHPQPTGATGNQDFVGKTVWVWAQARRGFQVADYSSNSKVRGYETLVAYDLDRRKEIGRTKLSPAAWASANRNGLPYGQPETIAVDQAGGRLFVAYGNPGPDPASTELAPWTGPGGNVFTPGTWDTGRPLSESGFGRAAGGDACLVHRVDEKHPCVGGIHVLDADTLEPRRARVPLRLVSVDGSPVQPILRAMTYSAPRLAGDAGKILMVVEEHINQQSTLGLLYAPRDFYSVHYLVQLDPETGVQDWSLRLDSCRGIRDWRNRQWYVVRPGAATVFRSQDPADPAIWVGCHNANQQATVVRVPLDERGFPAALPVRAADPGGMAEAGLAGQPPSEAVAPAATAETYFGPERTTEYLADPVAQRLLMKVEDNGAEVWFVFDTKKRSVIGTIGIGPFQDQHTASAIDPESGRLYVLAGGRLYVADVRGELIPQALVFDVGIKTVQPFPLSVAPATAGAPAQVFARMADASGGPDPGGFAVIEDRVPERADSEQEVEANRSLDVDEIEGVTASSLDGAARGYGFRALLVGGVDAVARAGRVDVVSQYNAVWTGVNVNGRGKSPVDVYSPCTAVNRDVVLAFVGPEGPAVVDGSGSRGGAVPIMVDSALRADMEGPVSRCTPLDWQRLWGTALFGRPPAEEPQVPWLFGAAPAECVSGERPSGSTGDAVVRAFAARVDCADDESVNGFSYARGTVVDQVGVGEALSSFRIYRDPGRGIVSRVESVARGVSITGVLRIASVRGTAESWANGRKQPVAEAEREAGYDSNCDFERSAGTCFQRHVFGVWTPGYQCGPCGDEAALLVGLNRALGANASARFREPDRALARGAGNGAIAAVTKPEVERFGDLVLNNDLLQTVVPTLEVIRFAPGSFLNDAGGGPTQRQPTRGRQIYQFAGVEASSSYSIQCLLVYDEAANTCGAQAEPPGSLALSLVDTAGAALAGGAFEVRADADADGLAGLADPLIPEGACVTAEDGIGTCRFDSLQPGGYLVSQVSAPAGFGKVDAPFKVDLASGEARTVTFTNAANKSVIQVTAQDESGAPIAGARFAVYPDPDADGKVAEDAEPAGQCATDGTGACSLQVPPGSYVLVQTSAPAGLEPIEPVAFALSSGGQTATVGIVNYPLDGTVPTPEPAAAPVIDYTDAPALAVVETVSDNVQAPSSGEHSPISVPTVMGDTIVRVIAAPGDALRLLARDPVQAVAWTASLLLFALAVIAAQRRRALLALLRS